MRLNNQQLSVRLETVAGFVPKNARLADIGSDHAYLPCVLAARDVVSYALAGEVVKGPFESAAEQIRTSGVGDRVSARLGDGMDVIEPTDRYQRRHHLRDGWGLDFQNSGKRQTER
jgi:tRNA (adenine22-N1)-methyltransferase